MGGKIRLKKANLKNLIRVDDSSEYGLATRKLLEKILEKEGVVFTLEEWITRNRWIIDSKIQSILRNQEEIIYNSQHIPYKDKHRMLLFINSNIPNYIYTFLMNAGYKPYYIGNRGIKVFR